MPDKKGIVPNSFQTPNAHVDHAMQFLSGDEYKVLNFAVRHILGWHDRVTDRKGRISLTTFCDGFTTKTGEHYGGTGLSRQGIVDIVERLDKWGLLIKDGEPTAAGQEYTIGIDPDWELIISDHAESTKGNKARGEKLRAAKAEKAARQAGDQSMPQTSGLSHRPVVYGIDGGQSIAQTDDQSMPQTHSNTSSNTSINPQGNTNTLSDDNVSEQDFPTPVVSDVNGKKKHTTVEENTVGTANAVHKTPPNSASPPSKRGHFDHYLALLQCFGYDPAKVTKVTRNNFMSVAVELNRIEFPTDKIAGLHAFVTDKAKRGNWSGWTVNALAKYANEYLMQTTGTGRESFIFSGLESQIIK